MAKPIYESVFYVNMEDCKPKNWRELSDAAKFMNKMYTRWADTYTHFLLQDIKSSHYIRDTLDKNLDNQEYHASMAQRAHLVYLGAKSAAISQIFCNFDSIENLRRTIDTAYAAGLVVDNFVTSAHELADGVVHEERLFKDYFMRTQNRAYDDIHRRTQELVDRNRTNLTDAMPEADAVVQVVREENGLLPVDLAVLIGRIMQNLRLG